MVSSTVDTVAEALRVSLAAISTSNGYNYTPGAVRRTSFYDEHALDPGLVTIYLIRPLRETTQPYDGLSDEERLEFRILCCHVFQEAHENPLTSDPVRQQIAAAMARDVRRKLRADVRLGRPDLVVDSMAEPWEIDLDWYEQSWSICELRIVVRYQHPQNEG